MRTIRIDVTKIDKSAIHVGAKGKYIDVVMFENRDGEDQYGNIGFVTQDIGKERRLAGERGPILGNFKEIGQSAPAPDRRPAPQENQASMDGVAVTDGDDDIPF